MKNNRANSFLVFSFILLPFILYVGYVMSGVVQTGVGIGGIPEYFSKHFLSPTTVTTGDKTVRVVLVFLLLWLMFVAYYYFEYSRNLIHGKEYGSSKWGSIRQFNKQFADRSKDKSKNKILSENIRMTYDAKTLKNNNMFVIGGSGAGKTAFVATPNLLSMHGSNIYTDPKGGLLQDFGNYLKKQTDTRVYQLNFVDMDKSLRFNPFEYIRRQEDVTRLIRNIMQNTTPTETVSTADPFWDKAESLYLQSLFLYVWLHCPREEEQYNRGSVSVITLNRDFKSFLYLMDEATVDDNDKKSDLDRRFQAIEQENPHDPCVITYNRFRQGAGDTLRSIIISANSRFNPFDNPSLLRILSGNDIPLEEFGTGKNADGKTKSNLFIIIPDDDDTFNFVPGMLFTLFFQELYAQARYFGGKLPIDVGFWLDEFANIKMPANFDKILATCRSRGVYCVPILQSLAQIKKLFKDGGWEGIVGNCDTFIYLGGNEKSTFEYVSQLLGKWTADKRSESESKGTSGSTSKSYDVVGRELLDLSEVRMLPNEKEIVLVRGEYPLIDHKWYPWEHKLYKDAVSYGEYDYMLEEEDNSELIELSDEQAIYYEKAADKENSLVYTHKFREEDMMMMPIVDLLSYVSQLDLNSDSKIDDATVNALIEDIDANIILAAEDNELEVMRQIEYERGYEEYAVSYPNMSLIEISVSEYLEPEKRDILKKLKKAKVPEEDIKTIISPKYDLETSTLLMKSALEFSQE